jgi:predicted peptidase
MHRLVLLASLGLFGCSSSDAVSADGSLPDLAAVDASVLDAAQIADGSAPDGGVPDGSAPDAARVLAPLAQGFHTRSMVSDGATYNYQIYIPTGYTPTTSWPVILFGHGSGEKGNDNMAQLTVGLGPYVQANQATFPAIVVFPQFPATLDAQPNKWALLRDVAVTALNQTLAEVNADLDRVYLTGLSYGAFRMWSVAYHQPTRFAALVLISGDVIGPDLTDVATTTQSDGRLLVASALKTVHIRTHHGANDTNVSPAGDREIAADFAAASATDFVYKEWAGQSHVMWDLVYTDPATWTWLFSQTR